MRRLMHTLTLACILFLPFLAAVAAEKGCTVHDGNRFYDLSKLKSNKDYVFHADGGRNYTINVCKSLVSETWNLEGPKSDDAAAVTRHDRGDFSLGAVSDTLLVRGGDPVLVYKDGSPCPKAKDMYASTAIRFICDRGVFASGRPELIATLPPDEESACAFVIEWRTHYACPAGGPIGIIGGIFYMIVFLLIAIFALYLIIGILYRRFALGLRGTDVLPRLTPAGCGDAFRFVRDALDDLWARRSDPFDRYGSAWSGWRTGHRGGGNDGYDAVPSTREEGEAMLADDDRESADGHDPWRGAPAPAANGMDRHGVIRL